ncbi:hypothetical protein HPP92_028924 [Vanilla planifolia]|uniref:Uncharacterized protein n=1 Tax=Vanilla planifolia TaxID=51239 RepID=A0A835P955_VANPL|nr:hypothetical protein HPP92_028914 [Vanilla planifolia]KAG0446277.1 hypothetical protein HPP92_028924 [Vanilla planifolia]
MVTPPDPWQRMSSRSMKTFQGLYNRSEIASVSSIHLKTSCAGDGTEQDIRWAHGLPQLTKKDVMPDQIFFRLLKYDSADRDLQACSVYGAF